MKCKKIKVHIVTDNIKRERLDNFCQSQMCAGCPLDKDFPCGRGTHFFTQFEPNIYDMSEEMIDKAYKRVFSETSRKRG